MKIILSSTIICLIGLVPSCVNADNTPNLCTEDIKDLIKIKPSQANQGVVPPNITVGGFEYNADAEHFVIGTQTSKHNNRVLVYIPGTTDRPELSSCLLKSVSEALPYPTIGLSYAFLSSGDSFRNGKCAFVGNTTGIPAQVDCLKQQHKDAIDGGTYGSTHFKADGVTPFWDPIEPQNSIKARLGFLFKYLDETNPNTGWEKFYSTDTKDFPVPRWNKIVFMGHSQGAGHAAYLGQTKHIRGAVMVSGPQDQCIDCPEDTTFWIDETYISKPGRKTAFASGVEPLINVMKDNWNRMTAAQATTWTPNKWGGVYPQDVGYAINAGPLDVCKAPLVTTVLPASTSTCGGKDHCSTAIDDSVPFIEKSNGDKQYLYDNIWAAIAKDGKRCKD